MSYGSKTRHWYPPEPTHGPGPSSYVIDIVALIAFFTAMILVIFLDYVFQVSQLGGSAQEMVVAAGFPVFFLLLLGGGVGILMLAFYSWRVGDYKLDFDFSFNFREVCVTIMSGIMYAGAIAVLYIISSSMFGGLSFSPMISTAQLMQPVGEEFAARGAVYGFMDRVVPGDEFWKFPIKGSPSALVFYLNHFWAYGPYMFMPGVAVFLFGSGFILSFAYWRERKLGVPIVAHETWNGVQLFKVM